MPFPASSATSRSTVPRTFRSRFILSCFRSPSKRLRLAARSNEIPCGTSIRSVLPGFLPSSRRHRRCPLMRERARPRYVPSSGFCNLSTAFSTSCFAGLFHPAATSRVTSVQGFVPVSQGPRLVAVTLPPCRFSALAHHSRSGPCGSYPSWLPRACPSTSRPCSAIRCVSPAGCLSLLASAPLFGFSSLRRSLRNREPGSPSHPLVTLTVSCPPLRGFTGGSPSAYFRLRRACVRLRTHGPVQGFEPFFFEP